MSFQEVAEQNAKYAMRIMELEREIKNRVVECQWAENAMFSLGLSFGLMVGFFLGVWVAS